MIGWNTPGLQITEFAVYADPHKKDIFTSHAMGTLDGKEVYVQLPRIFREMPSKSWVDEVVRQTQQINRPDLCKHLLTLAVGESLAMRTLHDHGYLNTLTI